MPKEPTLVVQEDATGCGIACAAMLAGTTYHAAKKRAKHLSIFPDDGKLYSDIYDLRTLLESYNIRIGKKMPFTSWEKIPSPAILAINYKADVESEFDSWHWVLFHKDKSGPVVLDPRRNLKSNKRRDLGKVNPKWYIPVGSV